MMRVQKMMKVQNMMELLKIMLENKFIQGLLYTSKDFNEAQGSSNLEDNSDNPKAASPTNNSQVMDDIESLEDEDIAPLSPFDEKNNENDENYDGSMLADTDDKLN